MQKHSKDNLIQTKENQLFQAEGVDDHQVHEESTNCEHSSMNEEELRKKFLLKFWLKAFKSRSEHAATEEVGILSKDDAGTNTQSDLPTLPVTSDVECLKPSLVTKEDLMFGPDWQKEEVVSCLRTYGVCCLLPGDDINQDLLEICRQAADNRFSELQEQCGQLDSNDMFTRELVCRNPGRYDMPHVSNRLNQRKIAIDFEQERHEALENSSSKQSQDVSSSAEDTSDALRKNSRWLTAVKGVLGVSAQMIHSGCVLATPGAALQGIHRDGKHLYLASETEGKALPAHCLTVFIPLVKLHEDCGPTEFFPGSHSSFSDEVEGGPSVKFVDAPAGSAIIFDYRILHRGLANESDQSRPMEYFTYSKPWFKDATNYSEISIHS